MNYALEWASDARQYIYRTMEQEATFRALELFERGDRYEIDGKKDYALGCDLKALKALERSFALRHMFDCTPFPWAKK